LNTRRLKYHGEFRSGDNPATPCENCGTQIGIITQAKNASWLCYVLQILPRSQKPSAT
jgi:hypothetical protein